jgi:16S rRNA (guanine527-N7)-methyltransferase
MPPPSDELAQAAAATGLPLSRAARAQFDLYLDTLLHWRTRLSLTAAATRTTIIQHHIADSFWVAVLIESDLRVADLGSGAGFPGVPLAIVRPAARITLVESRRKRANFLREVIRRLQLRNAEVIEGRAEDLPESLGSAFDVTMSRAVWCLSEFLAVSGKLLLEGGTAIALKGRRALVEAQDDEPGFRKLHAMMYDIPAGNQRALLVRILFHVKHFTAWRTCGTRRYKASWGIRGGGAGHLCRKSKGWRRQDDDGGKPISLPEPSRPPDSSH